MTCQLPKTDKVRDKEAVDLAEGTGAGTANVMGFPRANLRRILKDWAEDQVAIGRARRKGERAAGEEQHAASPAPQKTQQNGAGSK